VDYCNENKAAGNKIDKEGKGIDIEEMPLQRGNFVRARRGGGPGGPFIIANTEQDVRGRAKRGEIDCLNHWGGGGTRK